MHHFLSVFAILFFAQVQVVRPNALFIFFCGFYFFVAFKREKTLRAEAGGFTPSQGDRKKKKKKKTLFKGDGFFFLCDLFSRYYPGKA